MTDKVFQPEQAENIDAEFMENWLGGAKIDSLSPKNLFDLQTLMAHYKDIIVPMDNVKVSFPVEGFDTACASVDEKKIFIPTQVLQEGKIDDTIGLVIHELNHIKHSEKESTLVKVCSNFLMVALDSVFIESTEKGDYVSLKDIVYKGGFNFDNILKSNPSTTTEQFFTECLKGILLLLNAVEDVRIDANCPPNLKKYIDKLDTHGFADFKEHYEKGMLKEDTLMNIVYRLLFHHKGFIDDSLIGTRYGDTDYIRNHSPKEYIPPLLKEFRNEIKQYCEEVYNNFDMEKPTPQPTTDDYIQQMEQSSSDENFEKLMGDDKTFSEDCVEDIEFEDSELDPNKKFNDTQTVYSISQEEGRKLLAVPKYLEASIDIFKNVEIINCSEQFSINDNNHKTIEYKTLLIG